MARLHATALGPNSANVGRISLTLATAVLVASCATAPWSPANGEERFADRSLIYVETNQFLWADARRREQLVCRNGTPLVCTGAQNRLSLSHCGCLADD
jgi:hypothetical protein